MPRESLDLVPDETGERVVREVWDRLRDAGLPSQSGHRSPSNKVHLTLAEADRVVDPALSVTDVAVMLPLTLPVTGVVVLGAARVAVALLVGVPPELASAARRLRDGVGQLGPPWVPHVTLARQVPRYQAGSVVDAVGSHGISALRFVQLRHWDPRGRTVTNLGPSRASRT